MPKKFDEQEKIRIRERMLAAGRDLISRYGLKKTNVEELAKGAGIATGTFYKFYRTKEALFFDLLEQEERTIREHLLGRHLNGPMTKRKFRQFMAESFRLMAENPIIREVLLNDQMESVLRKVPPERLENNFKEDRDFLLALIQEWQQSGSLMNARPELIVSMIRSIVLLSLHKKEIGESIFDDTLDLLIGAVAEGLFIRNGEEGE